MKKSDTTMKYDIDADVLSWEMSKRAVIDHATEMGNIVVHFTKKNVPVLVEILNASQFLKQNEKTIEQVRKFALAG